MRSLTAVQKSSIARLSLWASFGGGCMSATTGHRLTNSEPHSNGRTMRLLSREVMRVSQSCIQRR